MANNNEEMSIKTGQMLGGEFVGFSRYSVKKKIFYWKMIRFEGRAIGRG